jgi:hypothetical protein
VERQDGRKQLEHFVPKHSPSFVDHLSRKHHKTPDLWQEHLFD